MGQRVGKSNHAARQSHRAGAAQRPRLTAPTGVPEVEAGCNSRASTSIPRIASTASGEVTTRTSDGCPASLQYDTSRPLGLGLLAIIIDHIVRLYMELVAEAALHATTVLCFSGGRHEASARSLGYFFPPSCGGAKQSWTRSLHKYESLRHQKSTYERSVRGHAGGSRGHVQIVPISAAPISHHSACSRLPPVFLEGSRCSPIPSESVLHVSRGHWL